MDLQEPAATPQFMQMIQKKEEDPMFQSMPYWAQLEIRSNVLKRELPLDETFKKIPQKFQKQIISNALFRVPKLKDKDFEKWVQGVSIKALQGDKGAQTSISDALANRKTARSSLIFGFFTRAFGSLTKGIPQPKYPEGVEHDPLIRALDKTTNVNTKRWKTHFVNLKTDDALKVEEYWSYLGNQDKKFNEQIKTFVGIGQAMGLIVDIMVAEKALAGSITAPRAIGKIIIGGLDKVAARSASLMVTKTIGAAKIISHSALTGAIGLAREHAVKTIDHMVYDPKGQKALINNAEIFGAYFLGDIVVNGLIGVVGPMLKSIGRNFIGWGRHQAFFKGVTEADFEKIFKQMTTAQEVDPVLLSRVAPEVQNSIKGTQISMRLFGNTELWKADDVLTAIAHYNGLTALKKGNVWELGKIGQPISKTVDSMDAAETWLRKELFKYNPKQVAKEAAVIGAGYDKIRVKSIIKGSLGAENVDNLDVLVNLAAPRNGRFTLDRVKGFVKALAKAEGGDQALLRSINVIEEGKVLKVSIAGKPITDFPKNVASPIQETAAISKISTALDELTSGQIGRKIKESYLQILQEEQLYTPAWVEYAVGKQGGKFLKVKDGFDIQLPGQQPQHFGNVLEAGKYTLINSLDEVSILQHLRRFESLDVRGKPGAWIIKKGKKELFKIDDLRKLGESHSELLPKIPNYLGPEITFVNNQLNLKYIKTAAIGSHHQILRHLDKFRDAKLDAIRIRLRSGSKGSISHNRLTRQVQVEIPQIAYKRHFDSIKKATEFLDGGWKKWDELRWIAAEKGYRLDTRGGKYLLYDSSTGRQFVGNDIADLSTKLAEAPRPGWAPELTGMSPEMVEQFPKVTNDFFKPETLTPKVPLDDMSAWVGLSQTWRPPEAIFVKAVEQGADPMWLKMFREMEDGLQIAAPMEANSAKIIHTLWQRKLGRAQMSWIKRAKRLAIGEHLEAVGTEAKAEVALKRGLDDADLRTVQRTREWFDEMAKKFNVKTGDLLENYLPRVRKHLLANPKKSYTDGSMRAFLKDAYGGNPPANIDAFFKHLRVSDAIDIALEKDPLVLMRHYSSVGHRQMVLGPLVKRIDDWVKAHPKLNPEVGHRFNTYRSDVMGLPQSHTEQVLKRASAALFEKLGLSKSLSIDLVRQSMSFMYLSSMGFRPYLMIRNSLQPFTTLAPRIGQKWVVKAFQAMADDTSGKLFDRLRANGVIRQHLPVWGGETFDPTSFLGKLVHKGLKGYKNSDEMTRVAAYLSTEMRFSEAVTKFKKGMFKSMDHFFDYSGTWQLPTDLKNQVRGFMSKGQFKAASNLFSTKMVEYTMFPYRAGMAPTSFRGIVGNMFGMFGHYPVYYVESIKQALKYSSPLQKVAFAGTWIGNMTAIYAAFKAVGIRADSFLFWQPALFSGGPLYHLANQALQSISPGYKGRQARGELFGVGTKGGPLKSELAKWAFTFQGKSLMRALDSAKAGDYYGAFLDFSSFPKSPDWFS